ncbi:hypothetical protein MKW94_019988 [Papaver nudicaule]|uniref:Uncharacterized protein n=1 Tax=Papaver nudicaule TaxID=74823 RepID=A0AA42APE5_PAPNU|nr:hypothetical protein [Papaver nudicaule]
MRGLVHGVTSIRDNYKRRKVSTTRDFPKDCGRHATRLNAKKVLESLVSEHSPSLDQIELASALKAVQTKDNELSKSLSQMESQEPVQSLDTLQPQPTKDFVSKKAHVTLKVADGVSDIREHPIGWSNVPRFRNESLSEDGLNTNPISLSNKSNKEIADYNKKLDKQSLDDSRNKRKVPEDFDHSVCTKNHGGESITISSVPKPPRSTLSVARPASKNGGVVTRSKVRETLRLFQAMSRKLLQEELKVPGTLSKRIDLITAEEMKKQEKWVNTGDKILGHVPGVEIGDEFHYRVELSIIGLHGPFQGGIDQVKKDGKILATSVVSSGGYDDIDNFDVLVYSGQGGNPASGNKKAKDQKLERGNLALKNSMDEKSPVRVIRGFKEMDGLDHTRGKTIATYTYDGLYLVERYWQEKGRHGNNVYMFELRRIPGQPELGLREVKQAKKSRLRKGLCVEDISQGEEKMRICAVNTLDSEKPPQFKYIAKMKYTSSHNLIPLKGGCECTNGCSDSEKCLCVVKNGGEIPFNEDGALLEQKTVVYECGPLCKCPPSCYNRVSQHGIKFQLEIFKTKSRGWGVRSLNSIPSGSFICEYTGKLLAEKEADQRTGCDEYLFDLGRIKSSSQILATGLSNENVEDEEGYFTIDALEYGSVSRFINHSCSPNLVTQDVLYDHDDKRMPHVMLFAGENIPPMRELTYDYNYVVDTVCDSSSGNIKIKECLCGSNECSGRMY